MTTSSANGRAQRKSLAEQIDRLDAILDGLADGLNEAVATAVKEGVSRAVEAALQELLASHELQRLLRAEQASRAGKDGSAIRVLGRGLLRVAQGCWNRIARIAAGCREKAAKALAAVAEERRAVVARVRTGLRAFGRRLWLGAVMTAAPVRHFGKPLLVALVVGTALGLGCYLAGPAVASAVSGLAGFAGSLLAGGLRRLQRMTACHDWEGWPVGRTRETALGGA
jgi:hypothetical protein